MVVPIFIKVVTFPLPVPGTAPTVATTEVLA